jgi:hypothetical protein
MIVMDASQELREILRRAEALSMGMLPCPTGQLVGCDPFFCADASPFLERIEPGAYLMRLHRLTVPGWGRRVGAAELVVRPNEIVRGFRLASCEPQRPPQYLVDSGLGSFMDERTRAEFAQTLKEFYQNSPKGNYYLDILESEFRATAENPADPFDAGDRDMHAYSNAPQAKVAMFRSGLGDGAYESFWGLDAAGQVLSLFTSFRVLSRTGHSFS